MREGREPVAPVPKKHALAQAGDVRQRKNGERVAIHWIDVRSTRCALFAASIDAGWAARSRARLGTARQDNICE